MKIKSLIIASAVAIAAATSAQAADVVAAREPVPAVVAPTFSWTGFYAGGQIGGSWSDTDVDASSGNVNAPRMSPKLSGFIGGLYAGYNYDMGNNLIIGAETDWIWADMNKTKTEPFSYQATAYTLGTKVKEQWAGATRIRVGYAVDRWLPYIAGGVAYAKVNTHYGSVTENFKSFEYMSGSDTMTGWTIGAGVDYALAQNVVLRLEYRYNDFGDKKYGNDIAKYRVDYKTNDVRVGVAYKF